MSADSQIMQAISEQYGAALKMLDDTILRCDDTVWQDSNRDPVISQVIYHTLYFVDYYLSRNKSESDSFKGKYGNDGGSFHEQERMFTKDQLTTYLHEIHAKADKIFQDFTIDTLNTEPVFDWHGSSILSSLLYNLRHIMLHVGALHVRINEIGKMPLRWVAKFPEEKGAELTDEAFFYLQSGNLSEAEKTYLTLCNGSDNPLFYYNLACCYSRQNKVDQAITTLKKCLNFDSSGRFKNLSKSDVDFANLRDLPEFNTLLH